MDHNKWRIGYNVGVDGKAMDWFVCRELDWAGRGLPLEYLLSDSGSMRRYKTYGAAQKVADKLNAQTD